MSFTKISVLVYHHKSNQRHFAVGIKKLTSQPKTQSSNVSQYYLSTDEPLG